VGVSAQARPAVLPLQGGEADACVTVYPLLCAQQLASPAYFVRPGGTLATLRAMADRGRRVWIPIQAFLVVHPGAGPLLIDTGFHPRVMEDPVAEHGPVLGRLAPFRMSPEQAVARQLDAHGIAPHELAAVILSHLHYDHASGAREFDQTTYLVDRAEWQAAADGGLREGYRQAHIDHPLDWRTVDFAGDGVAAHGAFAATLDLFGDGSVRLLSTPGHTRGHMSMLLRLRDREMLLCIDAIYTLASLTDDAMPLLCPDRERYLHSRAQIRAYAAQSPDAVIVPGHDPDAWAALDPVYT
jgi:glyoxylase-like metal-dependent hydrolase (beta-lactamase superfamily II)